MKPKTEYMKTNALRDAINTVRIETLQTHKKHIARISRDALTDGDIKSFSESEIILNAINSEINRLKAGR